MNVTSILSYQSQLRVWTSTRKDVSDRLTLLAGFRYLSLNEGGILVTQQAPAYAVDAMQRVQAFNNLFGGQIGFDAALLRHGRFSLGTDLKAGVYGDAASNSFAYDSDYLDVHDRTGTSATNVAFVGEIGITAGLNSTNTCRSGGYRCLWIDGVALASQQPAANPSPITGSATTITTGDLFYNGAFAGLEYRR